MLSKNDQNKEDVLKLQSFSRPPLAAGTYTLKTRLFNKSTGDLKGMPDQFEGTEIIFNVTAPRFNIGDDLIHSVYPLSGTTGAYQGTLPHVVFKRKTFPWERNINSDAELIKTPWICLLLLTEAEMKTSEVKEISIKDFLAPGAGIVLPAITLTASEKIAEGKMKVLETDLQLFKNIAPRLDELDYLVHNKQVDTTNKGNNDDNNDKGWFSTVVANRIPAEKETSTVFLVSLEGCKQYLEDKGNVKDAVKLRLAVLNQWDFTVKGETFKELIERLVKDKVNPLRIELPVDDKDKGIKTALEYGYTPVNHDRRNDKKTVSWYRGPFVPLYIPRYVTRSYKNADEALRFDENTDMFDISYATAWQLGRLLALQDAGFSTALSNWKNAYKRDRPVQIAKQLLTSDIGIQPDDLADLINEAESDEILTDYLIELWNKNINADQNN